MGPPEKLDFKGVLFPAASILKHVKHAYYTLNALIESIPVARILQEQEEWHPSVWGRQELIHPKNRYISNSLLTLIFMLGNMGA